VKSFLRPKFLLALAISALLAAGAVAVIATAFTPDPKEVCEGIPRHSGGCDPDQPRFSSPTCAGVGEEAGAELDRRGRAIIDGPTSVGGESRAVRLAEMVILVTGRANQYLRDNGMIKACGVDEFMAAAEMRFSEPLKARVGDYLFDDTSRPYSEWLADVRRMARVIDMGEDEPFLPPSPSAE
jgi:hypothetical protein